jgi:hypothetical protein
MTSRIRTYAELRRLNTIEERFEYLRLDGRVGQSTFGFDRYINQILYRDPMWLRARRIVIMRDGGCDLGIDEYEIYDQITIHHMNPLTIEAIENRDPKIFDPRYLISTSKRTHTAIHYGDASLLPKPLVVRQRNDTIPWK